MVKQVFKGVVFTLIKSVNYITDLPSANHAKTGTEKVRWRQPLNIWVPDDETNWLWDLFVLMVSFSRHGARYIPPSFSFNQEENQEEMYLYWQVVRDDVTQNPKQSESKQNGGQWKKNAFPGQRNGQLQPQIRYLRTKMVWKVQSYLLFYDFEEKWRWHRVFLMK